MYDIIIGIITIDIIISVIIIIIIAAVVVVLITYLFEVKQNRV